MCAEPVERASAGTLGDLLYADNRPSPSETEWVGWVQSIAAGDQQALYALYERTHRIVFTLTVRITRNREAAEEVTLDVFHDVWRRASTYNPANGSVLGWVMNQARSRAIDRLRAANRKKRTNAHPHDPVAAATENEPSKSVELREQAALLHGALTTLTPAERKAIETAFFAELSYAEVAKQLNEPLGTIKTRIRSGLRKLRQAFPREQRP